jgi:hypothetical protein
MQLKNKLNTKSYFALSFLNTSQYYVFLRDDVQLSIFISFYAGIVLNQYILAFVVSDLTGIEQNKGLLPTWLLGMFKPITLFIAFYIALSHSIENVHVFVAIYIFQLIILVISIKRIVKKN